MTARTPASNPAVDSATAALLRPYVPLTVSECLARAGFLTPCAEWLDGTLLIADVSGFTRLADAVSARGRMGTEQLIAILNAYYGRVLKAVARYSGRPFRFGGDSLVALFSDHDHARRAAACATAIHGSLARARGLPREAGGGRLQVSSGLHSGRFLLVVSGTASLGKQYVLLGTDVAIAVHAQDIASAGETCISAAAAALLGKAADVEGRKAEFRLLKGVSGQRRSMAMRPRTLPDAPANLDGFVHPAIVARLEARHADEADGEHRRVVALFLQIDGLHELADHWNEAAPSAVLGVVDQLVRAISAAAMARGGIVLGADPTATGQKFLIVFGLGQESEDDDARAALCALQLRRALRVMPTGVIWKIGINAGTVFAGDLGAGWRRDYTILGDVVNVAARLAASGGPEQIVAHAALADRLVGIMRLNQLDPAPAKGKPIPVPRVEVAGRRLAPVAPPRGAFACYGREAEQARLRLAANAARSQSTQVSVLLTGEPGIGKTALMGAEADDWEGRDGAVLAVSGRAYGGERPYAVWADALRSLLTIRRSDGAETERRRVTGALERWAPEDREWAPLVGGMIGVRFENDGIVRALEPGLRAARLFLLVARLLEGAAQERPLALLIDDLQATDGGSQDLLRHLLDRPVSAPLLLQAAARQRSDAPSPFDVELALTGLGDEALARVAAEAFGGRLLDEPVLAWVRSRSLGNPLHAKRLADSAREADAIEVLPGRGTVIARGDLQTLAAPDSIQAMMMAQVDRLPPIDRRVVQVASVCGVSFSAERLGWADPNAPSAQTAAALRRLNDARLLARAGDRLQFEQPLLQETVYASLPTQRRRPLHRLLAEALEQHRSGQDDEIDELAFHYSEAHDPRLITYALQAGERAQGLGDGATALRCYRAVGALPARAQGAHRDGSIAAQVNAGDVLFSFSAQYDPALKEYRRALARLLRVPADREIAAIGRVLHRIGRCERRLGREVAAVRALRRALRVLGTTDAAERADVLLELAGLVYYRGDIPAAISYCEQAMSEAAASATSEQAARALDYRGTFQSGAGKHEAAVLDFTASIALSAANTPSGVEANALNNLGAAYFWLGRWPDAVDAYRRAREVWRRIGDFDKRVQASSNLGEVLAVQGETQAAIELFEECRAAWEHSGFSIGVAHACLFAGQALARAGRLDSALDNLRRAATLLADLRLEGIASYAYASLAEALADAHDGQAAGEAAATAARLAERAPSAMYRAYALRAVGAAAGTDDRHATEWLASAERAFLQLGMHYDAAIAQLRRAESATFLTASAATRDAQRAAAAAVSTFARLGARLDHARALDVLERLQSGG
ncbi:MAG: AAA family ATPase [Dehalococcoidia bacterium]